MKFQSIRGMNDIGGDNIHLWRFVEKQVRGLYENFGFNPVITPELESTALFKRGVGDTSDIVEKEMYTFEDRNGDSLTLRPEGTASVVRAVLQNNWLHDSPILKLYYFMPMFRHERPQKGRYRLHYQFGLEIFGVQGAEADVEVIALQAAVFEKLEISNLELFINSIGCNVCRPPFREKLTVILKKVSDKLCGDCQRRIEKNPLRVFDCKVETCQQIAKTLPTQIDNLCEACVTHMKGVKQGLENLNINYKINPQIVRGIDYYNRTCFEFVSANIGAQGTVCGGGRYDHLVEELGGKSTPGFGVGMGMERILLLLESKKSSVQPQPDLAVVYADEQGKNFGCKLTFELRQLGLFVDFDLDGKSVKAQMKRANKSGARYSLVIGEQEVNQLSAKIKRMSDSQEQGVDLKSLKAIKEVCREVRG
ncbi:MAG: histidine--tRNA ligase [Pseudomonadota bacterium]|nr:histidine--tRNA ligase [Pseudomonadota bacterium]